MPPVWSKEDPQLTILSENSFNACVAATGWDYSQEQTLQSTFP
jgi:hypothetical protein